jgi:type IV fimbrial biogenesis protein FimT
MPAVQAFVLDGRRIADVNGFVLAVQTARSEAQKRGHPVVLCRSQDAAACDHDAPPSAGWIVFVNTDDVRPPQRSASEPLLLAHEPEIAGAITANRAYFEFRPYRQRSVNGTVVFCDRRGPAAARAVIVSYTGRPRVDSKDAAGKPLRCAGFP